MNEPKTTSAPEPLIANLLAKVELHVRSRNYVQAMRTIKIFADEHNAAIVSPARTYKELRQLPVQSIDVHIGTLGLRVVNMLEKEGIKTIGQLIEALKIGRVAGLPNSGHKTVQHIRRAIEKLLEQCQLQESHHLECLADLESCPGTGLHQQGSDDHEDAASC